MAMYLILSIKHSPDDRGNAVWWGDSQSGYYSDLDSAGRYTREQADQIAERAGEDVAVVPIATAQRLARLTVGYTEVFGTLPFTT